MYTRRNVWPDAPGHWTTADGEYEFSKMGATWKALHRAHWNTDTRRHEVRTIGTGRTLGDVFALASRHYAHPVVPVDQWEYPVESRYVCSGDIPAGHVECDFTTDSYDAANTHFERTGHNVDEVCATCEPGTYHPSIVNDLPQETHS